MIDITLYGPVRRRKLDGAEFVLTFELCANRERVQDCRPGPTWLDFSEANPIVRVAKLRVTEDSSTPYIEPG